MQTSLEAGRFLDMTREALPPAAKYIRDAILGRIDIAEYLVKGDKTLVTVVDSRSEEITRPYVLDVFPEAMLNQEESGVTGASDAEITIDHDPLDGTRGFLFGGPTPTIILAAYDTDRKCYVACATMEPVTGRAWLSIAGEGAYQNRFDYELDRWTEKDAGTSIHVNSHEFRNDGTVLVDVTHPFARKVSTDAEGKSILKRILTTAGRRELTTLIEEAGGKELTFNTNGSHYAYVAMGRPTLVGNITTAIGGPYDVAGMLHVLEAGGHIGAFAIGEDRRPIRLQNPQDVANADIVYATNTPENLASIAEAIECAIRAP